MRSVVPARYQKGKKKEGKRKRAREKEREGDREIKTETTQKPKKGTIFQLTILCEGSETRKLT